MRKRLSEKKRKRNNCKTLRKMHKGGGSRMHYYVEPTLGISKEEFLGKLSTIRKVSVLGRGVYGEVQLVLLDGMKLVIKEIHMKLPKQSINNYIAHSDTIHELTTKNIMIELLNEAQALSELVNNETTRNYVPPFIGLLVSDSFELVLGGGKPNMKRVSSMKKLRGRNNEEITLKTTIFIPPGSPDSNISEFAEYDKLHFISKYIYGDTLFNVLNRNSTLLSDDMVSRIYADFRTALHAIHNAGWIHCDIHSKNLYIEFDNENNYKGVRILDFGKALRVGSMTVKKPSYTRWVPEDDMKALDVTMQTIMGALSTMKTRMSALSTSDKPVVSNNNDNNDNNENMVGENFNEAEAEAYLKSLYGSVAPVAKRGRFNTNTTRVNSRIINTNNFNTRKRKIPVRLK
jgi:serine/threonine protein kinase